MQMYEHELNFYGKADDEEYRQARQWQPDASGDIRGRTEIRSDPEGNNGIDEELRETKGYSDISDNEGSKQIFGSGNERSFSINGEESGSDEHRTRSADLNRETARGVTSDMRTIQTSSISAVEILSRVRCIQASPPETKTECEQ